MSNYRDLTGLRFSRLLVMARAGTARFGQPTWHCQCDCGTEKVILGLKLRGENIRSCGCLRREMLVTRNTKGRPVRGPEIKHLYKIWLAMRQRCNNPLHQKYHRYGGRGITVCPAWDSYETFVADMGARPSLSHSIDRINNDLGYNPENCRWATPKEQANNRSPRTHVIPQVRKR